jgi:hypothetical protein
MSIDPKLNNRLREWRTSQEAAGEGSLDDAGELHVWAEWLDQEFGLGLPTQVILIGSARVPPPGGNGRGPRHEVRVESADLDLPLAFRLAGLLRELLRLREVVEGWPYPRPYLSAAVRGTARGYGLSFDRHGRLRRLQAGPFTALLRQRGVDVEPLWDSLEESRREERRPKKWACGCSVVLSVARLRARCTRCRRPFTRAEPAKESTTNVLSLQGMRP